MLKSGIIVALLTLLSRFFGLARELFIAATFGTSYIADCVNVAFKLPNLFRRIFAEGALSAVFIPMFSKKLHSSKEEALEFGGKIFTILFFVLVVLTIVLQLAMPYLMMIIAPGFFLEDTKFDLAVILCRITMPYMVFISITALFGGVLNSVKKFAAFAFTPIIMNICIITLTPLLEAKYTAHFGVVYSLIIAGILQVVFMYYCLIRAKLKIGFLFSNSNDSDVRKLARKMTPAAMSSGVQQINLFISQSIASFLPGAVSILSYADRLYQLPLSLIGVTFGTILLPELSYIYKKQDYSNANKLQNRSIRIALVISIPAMCGLLALSHPIIHLIYERGEFSASDAIDVARALSAFSFGLPAFVLAKILTPIFYANLDTKTPFRITLYSLVTNTVLNILLMIPFGYVGIAVGSSIAAWFNLFLLNKYAKNYGEFRITYETKIFIFKVLVSSVFMVLFIEIAEYHFGELFFSDSFMIKALSLLGTIATAIVIFVLFSYLSKMHKVL